MFDTIRLRREMWQIYGRDGKPDVIKLQQFAEELIAELESTKELTHNAPINANGPQNPNATVAPFNSFPNYDQPGFTINNPDGSRTDIGQDGTITTTPAGGGTPQQQGGGGLIGKIVSGSGTSYTVGIYENGLSAAATRTVTATAPYLNSDEDIPNNSVVGVVRAGTVYHILTAYWL